MPICLHRAATPVPWRAASPAWPAWPAGLAPALWLLAALASGPLWAAPPSPAPAATTATATTTIVRPPGATPALLKALSAWDREQALQARQCRQQARRVGRPASYQLRYRVVLHSAALYAVQYQLQTSCGGPYPTVQTGGVSFEVGTGARYHPARLYRIGEPSQQPFEFLATTLYPATSEWVRARLLETGGADCQEFIGQARLNVAETVSLGQNGLLVQVPAPHAVQACFAPVELPYESLRETLDPAEAQRLGWGR